MSLALEVLIQVVGWIYFFAWSISFYPQIYINQKAKSVRGFSIEFAAYNFTGFLAYSIYNLWAFCDPGVIPGMVLINDVVFAVHALVMTLITVAQAAVYERGGQKPGLFSYCFMAFCYGSSLIIIPIYLAGKLPTNHDFNGVLWLGYIKILITVIKYIPQAIMNYIRKSTKGWSILNIFLDFTGGCFSIIQILLIGANTGNWNVFAGGGSFNIAKFFLGFTSMVFDLIFMFQHYILYPPRKQIVVETDEYGESLIPMDHREINTTPKNTAF